MIEFTSGAKVVNTPDGRVFTWQSFKPYTRKDGTDTELSVWQASCAICGELFTVTTPKTGDTKAFYRKHCDIHKGGHCND